MSLEGTSGSVSPADRGEAVAADVPASPASEPRWFVVHTRSRQEKALAADLAAMRVTSYLPLSSAVRYYGRRKMRVELPLFPGYVFLWGSIEEAYAADRTRRVVQLIPVVNQARFAEELESVRRALEGGAELEPHPYLQAGTPVEVRSGPFKGVRGVVENRVKADRLCIQIEALGQASSLEIDGALLEPIESLASSPLVST